jgi:phage/plasmid-like protein (TIGR03299 family)
MPANLDERDGRIACMVVGKPAWHGLGTVLQRPANAAEAIEAASLGWRVVKKSLFAGENEYRRVPQYFSIVREDDWNSNKGTVLGIVGKGYTPLQNRDAFAFFDPIVGQDEAVYHTAGALGKGERVWILAKLPGEIRVIGDDITHKYLLLSNSHDGNSAVQIKFTPIRVVCENTLTQALRGGPTLRVAHTKDIEKRLKIAALLLRAIQYRFTEIEDIFRATARAKMDRERLGQYLLDVFPDPRRTQGDERYDRSLAQAQ